jgi:hypothetical protein
MRDPLTTACRETTDLGRDDLVVPARDVGRCEGKTRLLAGAKRLKCVVAKRDFLRCMRG